MKRLSVAALVAGLLALPAAAWGRTHPVPKAGSYRGHTTQTDRFGNHAGVGFSFAHRTVSGFAIQFRESCSSGHALFAELSHVRFGRISGIGLLGHPSPTYGPYTLFDNSPGFERSTYFLAVILVGANRITGQFQAHTRLYNAAGLQVDDCRMPVTSWSATRVP